MFLYNISVIAEQDTGESARKMILKHVHTAAAAGISVSLLELLNSPHEGITYCVQLHADDMESITLLQQKLLNPLQDEANRLHPGKVLFFDSLMKYL